MNSDIVVIGYGICLILVQAQVLLLLKKINKLTEKIDPKIIDGNKTNEPR